MAVTILETLQNAQINLIDMAGSGLAYQIQIGKEQLYNAISLLEKGYSIDDKVEPLLNEYGSVDSVPQKQ